MLQSTPQGRFADTREIDSDSLGQYVSLESSTAYGDSVTVEEFEETAMCAGLSDSLTAALAAEENFEVRFLILDAIGRLENFLHKS